MADRIFLAEVPMAITAIEIISRVMPKRIGSMIAIAITEPTKISAPPAASTSP